MNLKPFAPQRDQKGSRRARFTAAEKKYIADNRLISPSSVLAKHLNCSKTMVQRFIADNGLTPPKEVIERFRRERLMGTSATPEQDETIKANYLIVPIKRLAAMIGRSDTFVRRRMIEFGLVIPEEITLKRKIDSRRKPGDIPGNKGKKLTPEQYAKSKPTMFKKGIVPKNTKPDLTITIRKDKRGVPYKHIRIGKGYWVPLHRFNWINAHGPIAPKMKIAFKDGNTLNRKIENLEMLTPAEMMRRNTVHNLPKPLAEIVQLRGAVNRQINKHLKKQKNEKQNQ